VEESWKRPLTEEERAALDGWLAVRPGERAVWETETALNRALGSLPNRPVSSNFTALVMQAVEREARASQTTPSAPESFWSRLLAVFRLPAIRLAWAVLLVCGIGLGFYTHQTNVHRDVAEGLKAVANVASVPSLSDPSVFEDFDAIRRLGQSSASDDEELYMVLNK
jgi:ferric-dicitrate binding protein FerR (iron transport regulator)